MDDEPRPAGSPDEPPDTPTWGAAPPPPDTPTWGAAPPPPDTPTWGAAPPPWAAQAPAAHLDLTASEAPPRPRRRVGVVAAAVGVVVGVVAGIVGVVALTGPGANTPSDAVRGLLTAAGNADVLGVLDHIDPPERDALTGFVTNGTADLQRLGIAGSGLDLHHVSGFSATFDNVQTSETPLRSDLTAVHITGGTVHAHFDPSLLPVGSFVQQHAGTALSKTGVKDVTEPIHFDGAIVTVNRGGTWYVSLGYTAAEAARVAAKLAPPDPAAAVPAAGDSSPTAAVSDFVHALAAVDVRRMIELTPPDEMGALHDYAPLFLPKVDAALKQAPPYSVTITALDLTSSDHPGGQLVKISRLGVHATFGSTTVDLAPDSKCPTITGSTSVDLSTFCGASAAGGSAPGATVPPGLSNALKSLQGIRADVGIVAVERNGSWYVSPTRTILDDLESVLHNLPTDILTQLKDAFSPSAILGAGRSAAISGLTSNATGPTELCFVSPRPGGPGQGTAVTGPCPPASPGAG